MDGEDDRLEEAMKLLEEGWRPYPNVHEDKTRGRFEVALRSPDGSKRRRYKFKGEGARERAEEFLAAILKGYEAEGGEEVKGRGERPMSNIELWWTKVQRERPLIQGIVEKVGWMQDAIYDVGFAALFVSLQFAKVRPDEVYSLLERFRDKDEFIRYVLQHLGALLESSKDAARILELEDERRALTVQLEFAKWVLEKLKEQRDEALMDLRMAIACMTERSLRRWADSMAMMSVATPPPSSTQSSSQPQEE